MVDQSKDLLQPWKTTLTLFRSKSKTKERDIQRIFKIKRLEYSFKPRTMILNPCFSISCAVIFFCTLNQLIIYSKLIKY